MTDEKYLAKEQEFSALIKASNTEGLSSFIRENTDILDKLRLKTEIYVSLATMLTSLSVLAILLENEFAPKEGKLALTSVIKKGRYDVLHLVKQYTDYTFDDEIEDGIKKYIKDTAPKKELTKPLKKEIKKEVVEVVKTPEKPLIKKIDEPLVVDSHNENAYDFFDQKIKENKEKETLVVDNSRVIEENEDGGFTMLAFDDKSQKKPEGVQKNKETVINDFKSVMGHVNADIIKELNLKVKTLEDELVIAKASKSVVDGDIEKKLLSNEAEIFRLKNELKDQSQATSYYREEYTKLDKSFNDKLNAIKEDLSISTSVWEDIISHQQVEEYIAKSQFVERSAYGAPIELTELYNSSDVNEQDKFYALLSAISYSRYENVLSMIYSFNTNINLESGSALVKAVNTDNDLIVGLLIQNGANIALGKYQILEHYILKNNIKMVNLLLKNNAIPFDEMNRFLMAAVDNGYTDIAKLLILNKAPFLYRDGQIIEQIEKNRELMSFIQVNF